jgi:hypothetical protein
MTPSKMIQFFQGEPTEDKKREIEHRMAKKFAGAENAGKFLLVFNAVNASRSVEVNDLSASDLDKHMIELNKTCQQEIFSGHRVTSPMLFGIKTEGQLGGNTELKASYELFQSTYAKPKANAFDKELNYILSFSSKPGKYELRPTDPIGWQVPEALLAQAISPDDVREKLGLPVIEKSVDNQASRTLAAINGMSPLVANKVLEKLTDNEIRALAALDAKPGGDSLPIPEGGAIVDDPTLDSDEPQLPINSILTNLSAKQLQHVERVIRKYSQGKITEAMAKILLRSGLGLSDNEINQILGIQPAAMSAIDEEEAIADVFDEYGDNREDYDIIKSKKVCFSSDFEAEEDEAIFIQEAFKTLDVTNTEKAILDLLKTDPKATPEVIAAAINQTKKYVTSKLANLVKRGILERASEMIGADEIISHIIPEAVDVIPPVETTPPVQIMVKYSYEVKPGIGPAVIETTRPFCRKMIQLNRLYSRMEIEAISLRLGYSVWDRRGGWWGNKPECRHRWVSSIVVKKK